MSDIYIFKDIYYIHFSREAYLPRSSASSCERMRNLSQFLIKQTCS